MFSMRKSRDMGIEEDKSLETSKLSSIKSQLTNRLHSVAHELQCDWLIVTLCSDWLIPG